MISLQHAMVSQAQDPHHGLFAKQATVSRLEVEGKLFDSRIQGGILSDGLSGVLAGLFTIVRGIHSAQ